ncbi:MULTISPECIES: hypothetical protein [unclassified Mesorhizobium]|uniref:hypothetical protein n=1 Tax=unclassified Mesorhizobium TaxID=325217 RepID=UPI002414F3FE|nr:MULTISPECIES: hypothetical protein [unclassified Mesorhizobium]MDG4854070.1 hypothetical protein [Mesorhizobium sp. WSM4982]MDG4910914.1 hypothetical protein [Mesorhizobium sp. WSM4983]
MTPQFEAASAAAGRAAARLLAKYKQEDVAAALLVAALGVAAADKGEGALLAAKLILAKVAGGTHG